MQCELCDICPPTVEIVSVNVDHLNCQFLILLNCHSALIDLFALSMYEMKIFEI